MSPVFPARFPGGATQDIVCPGDRGPVKVPRLTISGMEPPPHAARLPSPYRSGCDGSALLFELRMSLRFESTLHVISTGAAAGPRSGEIWAGERIQHPASKLKIPTGVAAGAEASAFPFPERSQRLVRWELRIENSKLRIRSCVAQPSKIQHPRSNGKSPPGEVGMYRVQ